MIGVGAAGPLGETAGEANAGPRHLEAGGARWGRLPLSALDPEEERPYWVAISQVPGIGPVSFARILERFGSARAAWSAGPSLLDGMPRLPPEATAVLRRLRRRSASGVLADVEASLRRVGGRTMTALDAEYPPALRQADPRPAVVYFAGDVSAFDAPGVAVVGTRRASGYGRACATQVADALARGGAVVVSGLALGIDGEAHAAAIDAGGRSIAVLPSPLDRIYPPRHRRLAARLAATGGGVLSELAPGQLPGRPDFARRNRIIAGLGMATVVIEAPDRSGALLTASAAIELGRELYAVPGPIDAAGSRGCNRLIADHLAHLVTSPAGLLTHLGLPSGVERPLAVASLSENEALVLARLLKRPGSVEELMLPTGMSTGALASALTLLEARGLITSYGGATFHPTLAARRIERRT